MVQSEDDTLLFCDDNDIKKALQILQKSCQNLSLYFTKQSLKLKTKKTDLIITSKNFKAETTIKKSA